MNTEQMNEAEEIYSVDFDDEGQSSEVESSSEGEQMFANEEKEETAAKENELENYSDNVQKRINQLTAKRKQAMEEAEAAYQYAQQVQSQNEEMKKRLADLDKGYIEEYGSRVESQHEQAKRLMKEAYDAGDMDKVADAQEIIAKLAIEKERLRVQKMKAEEPVEEVAQAPQPPQRPSQQDLDPKLVNWMGKNDNWFGKDMVMTRGAQAIHETLVGSEGFDPTSDDYYAEIDKRMRQEFPHKFQTQRQNAQPVAPASSPGRSVKSGRKKTVELTPGQVAFAKKMNIPLERYAKEVAKIETTRR